MPVDKFQLFRYIREQDHVLDAVKDTLDLISMRSDPGIPEELNKDFSLLVDAVIEPIESLAGLVLEEGGVGLVAVGLGEHEVGADLVLEAQLQDSVRARW